MSQRYRRKTRARVNGEPAAPEGNGHVRFAEVLGAQGARAHEAHKNDRTPRTDLIDIGTDRTCLQHEPGFRPGTMADIAQKVQGIKYLVPGWIPFGALTQVIGEPGVGKSLLLLWLIRCLVLCKRWFNGALGFPDTRCVVLCDTEGRFGVNLDRLRKWGLPEEALGRILSPFDGTDLLTPVDLTNPFHLNRIERAIVRHKCPLVVIDSLRGAHGREENDSKIAGLLQPLVEMAQRTGAAIILVHHARKLGFDEDLCANSSRGSNAIQASFLAQIGVDRPDPNSPWRRVRMLKENLGLAPEPWGFLPWDGGLEIGAAPVRPVKDRVPKRRNEAAEWLRERMTPGAWCEAAVLEKEATAKGFDLTGTLYRARRELGVTKDRNNIRKSGGRSQWRLPAE
jgi:hypothetical protein